MLVPQISHSPDLKRLRDEGYHIEVFGGHLFAHEIPYVNSSKEVKKGVLIAPLTFSGNRCQKPQNHVVFFSGSDPCDKNGMIIKGVQHSLNQSKFGNGVNSERSFSNKPRNGYPDFYEKFKTYSDIISAPAKALDPDVTKTPYLPVIEDTEESVFNYYDTNSSRSNIEDINHKVHGQKIAIIGLGGTGAYILDSVSKTCVAEIHIFDGDIFSNHNAFRSPGAASVESLNKREKKTRYFGRMYSEMRNGIFEHDYYLDEENLKELAGFDYVFLSLDNNGARRVLVEYLTNQGITFFDVGLGVNVVDERLVGMVRVTTGTSTKNDHYEGKIPFYDSEDNDYVTNIQISDLNSLNANYAVIKWKKISGIYQDLEQEHFSAYSINTSHLINDDQAEA
jgi:hypothetical protein